MVKAEKREAKIKKKGSNRVYHFFKVYLSKYSSKKLDIPRAAIPWFGRVTQPKDVLLHDRAGRKWNCKMEIVNDRLAIKDGWRRFSHEHLLEDGDFLTFVYNGDSLFDVKVFALNGILKKETETDYAEAIEDTNTEPNGEDGEEAEQTSKESEGSTKCTGSVLPQSLQAKPRANAIPIQETQIACASSSTLVLQNAHFWADITPTSEYALNVSQKAMKLLRIDVKPILMLCDEEGRKWPVKVAFRKDGRVAFTKGWADFYRRNNLKVLDRCLFKFVVDAENISGEVMVQILRSGVATLNVYSNF